MTEQNFCLKLQRLRSNSFKGFPLAEALIFSGIAFFLLGDDEVGVKIIGGVFLGLALGNSLSYLITYRKGISFFCRLSKYINWDAINRIAEGSVPESDNLHKREERDNE